MRKGLNLRNGLGLELECFFFFFAAAAAEEKKKEEGEREGQEEKEAEMLHSYIGLDSFCDSRYQPFEKK